MFTFKFLVKNRSISGALRKIGRVKLCQHGEEYTHRQIHSLEPATKATQFPQLQKELQIQVKEKDIEDFPYNDPEDAILSNPDFFKVKEMVTLRDLFNARVHYGHKAGCRNEYMREFLFGSRLNIDIIDLEQSIGMLHDALNFAAHIAYRQGVILFISRNIQTIYKVEKLAKDCGEYSHCRRWQVGLFTNTRGHFSNEIRMPDLVVFLHTKNDAFEQHEAIRECAKLCIPTIGIVDSNCDPRLITYPIPGNDDSVASVDLYLQLFKEAIKRGKDQCVKDKELSKENVKPNSNEAEQQTLSDRK